MSDRVSKLNAAEEKHGIQGNIQASWHQEYNDTNWVYFGNVADGLSEGDVLTLFSQYGEIEDIELIRDKDTGKSKGFGFLKYEDWYSTVLAVDNFNGIEVLGKRLFVDHKRYERQKGKSTAKGTSAETKEKKEEEEEAEEAEEEDDDDDDGSENRTNSKAEKKRKKKKKKKKKKKEKKKKEKKKEKEGASRKRLRDQSSDDSHSLDLGLPNKKTTEAKETLAERRARLAKLSTMAPVGWDGNKK